MSRITKPEWLQNPWRTNPWFESVAVAQQRARKRLPAPVYGALVAGSERGQSISYNQSGFSHLGFAPPVAHIGRASFRERFCQSVFISVFAVSLKKKILSFFLLFFLSSFFFFFFFFF